MQCFNDYKSKNCKPQIQHQCSVISFFETFYFLCAKILDTYGETAFPMDTKISEKTFSTRIVARITGECPVYRMDLQLLYDHHTNGYCGLLEN